MLQKKDYQQQQRYQTPTKTNATKEGYQQHQQKLMLQKKDYQQQHQQKLMLQKKEYQQQQSYQ